MNNVSPDGHTLTHFVPKMPPIGMTTLVLIEIHEFRALIPLCIPMLVRYMVCLCYVHHASDSHVRLHEYKRCLSHIRVPTHVRPGTVFLR